MFKKVGEKSASVNAVKQPGYLKQRPVAFRPYLAISLASQTVITESMTPVGLDLY